MSQPRKTGVLLINLGTPDAPEIPEVRRYLRDFLSDPRVIDMNPVGRFLLLHLVILPFRPRKSAEAYRLIWGEGGSPLLRHGLDLVGRLREELGAGTPVAVTTPSVAAVTAVTVASGPVSSTAETSGGAGPISSTARIAGGAFIILLAHC